MSLPIISVNSVWKTVFDFFIILASLIYCMKLIYYLTFYEEYHETDLFDYFVIISYAIYIILNFFQSYIDKETGEIIYSNKKIALNYLKGWFIIDSLSTFPWEIISDTPYLRLIRFVRINKILQFFSFVERVSFKMRHTISLFRLGFFGIFGTFILSCLWFIYCLHFQKKYEKLNFLTENKLSKKDPLNSLLNCFYFSLTTITTTGFGDLTAKNIYEKIFATLMMLIGVLYFSFLMSVLYEEIRNVGEDNQILDAQKLIFDLKQFNIGKSNKSFRERIDKKILADVMFNVQHSRYEQETKKVNFDILPRKIKNILSDYLWKDVFKQLTDYFKLLESSKLETFLCKLSYHFKYKFYNKKEVIFHPNRNINEMNIIQSGYVDVINYISSLKIRLKPGDVIGHFYLLYDLKPNYAFVAATRIEVISVEKKKLMKLFDNMIDKKIYNNMRNASMTKFKEIFKMINNSKKYKGNKYQNKNNNEFIII